MTRATRSPAAPTVAPGVPMDGLIRRFIDGLPREEVPSDLLVVPDSEVSPRPGGRAGSRVFRSFLSPCSSLDRMLGDCARGRAGFRCAETGPPVRFSRTTAAAASVPALGGRARLGRRKSTEHPARKPGVDRNLASPRVESPTKPRDGYRTRPFLLPSGREGAGDRRRESRARRAPHSGPRRRHEDSPTQSRRAPSAHPSAPCRDTGPPPPCPEAELAGACGPHVRSRGPAGFREVAFRGEGRRDRLSHTRRACRGGEPGAGPVPRGPAPGPGWLRARRPSPRSSSPGRAGSSRQAGSSPPG